MSVETPHYTYFTVTGRYLRRIIDGPDEDRLPDVVPSTGSFIFTPKAPTFKDLSIPATFENVTQTGTLDAAGFLVDEQGRPGVVLMSGNSPHISPHGWTWSVTPVVNGKQGTPFDLPADIEPGSTVDLTIVSPAASSAGAVIIVSEASRVAAETARDQAVAAAESLLDGLEGAIEAYLLENPPEGGGAVDSVNGRVGVVSLTAADVGAVPVTRTVAGKPLSADVTLTASDVSAVPTTRTVAGKALSSNVTLSQADVGLSNVDNTSDSAKPVSTAVQAALDGKVDKTTTVAGKALSGNVTLTASDVSAVPTSRTVAGKTLSSNVTLNKSDVGLSTVPEFYSATPLAAGATLPAGFVGVVLRFTE